MTIDRQFQVIEAGFAGDATTAREGLTDDDSAVRASALRALHRIGVLEAATLTHLLTDSHHEVRRTAVELSATRNEVIIHPLIDDPDIFVAEMTAWSLGERSSIRDIEIETLVDRTTSHSESIVREACAAALGALGDERGLVAILAACKDKPAVRRRAILALAPFEGELVDAALYAALEDKDWQVRQNAEDLINPRS